MNEERQDKVLGYILYGLLGTLIVFGVPFILWAS